MAKSLIDQEIIPELMKQSTIPFFLYTRFCLNVSCRPLEDCRPMDYLYVDEFSDIW